MRFGMVTLSLSMFLVGATAEAQRQLRVESMTSNNCRVVDHNGTTGDDSGGIAVSAQKVYYNGDSAAGEFNLNDLGAQRRVSGSALLDDLEPSRRQALCALEQPGEPARLGADHHERHSLQRAQEARREPQPHTDHDHAVAVD